MNLNNIIKQSNFKNKNNSELKRVYGKVIGKVENTNNKFKVSIQERENLIVSLTNKTGQPLQKDDYVWVHYWNKISQGYIGSVNKEYGISISEFGTVTCTINAGATYGDVEINLGERYTNNPLVIVQLREDSNTCNGNHNVIPFTSFSKNGFGEKICDVHLHSLHSQGQYSTPSIGTWYVDYIVISQD